ncbi:hypothetical protein PPL_01209 [Heterostelium album PN500]|uniref:Hexosyltransferase n=1 Tax=Heterostelium pallidum (strain ATCC 26659 / Pp 5 / PN500) TaxID=670386 RepID=D3AYE9_HETP5|nr:hypothetical protein PPL_01209 [Heterostelium album PN500]EFA85976.1 hypothetical protein PPL_01209 [Heterostelium album PN500]|eukprot:XP_020438082.1 hypothetical protein PPL_01209 [Heterostelium album PN500]
MYILSSKKYQNKLILLFILCFLSLILFSNINSLSPTNKTLDHPVTHLYNITSYSPITILVLTSDSKKDSRTKLIRHTWGGKAKLRGWKVYYYSESDQEYPSDTIALGCSQNEDTKKWRALLHARDCSVQPSNFYILVNDTVTLNIGELSKKIEELSEKQPLVYGQCITVDWKTKPYCGGGDLTIFNRKGLELIMKMFLSGECREYNSRSDCFYETNIKYDLGFGTFPESPTTLKHFLNNNLSFQILNIENLIY